jgi:hypothetical protein
MILSIPWLVKGICPKNPALSVSNPFTQAKNGMKKPRNRLVSPWKGKASAVL